MSASYFMLRFLRKKRAKSQSRYETEKHNKHRVIDPSGEQNNYQCRICLKAGIIPIFSSGLSFNVQDAIKTFGDVEIEEDDAYPKHLCDTCHFHLNSAVLFRKSAKESDRILRLTRTLTPPEFQDSSGISEDITPLESADNSYKSNTCDLNYSSFSCSAYRTKKQQNVRIQCPICNRLFSPQLYKNHLKRHQSTSHLICEICGKLYRKDNLARHLKMHTYDLPFHCQVCPYRGRFMESLKIHMRGHSGEKPFSCDKCELQFITRSNLNRHLLTHKKEKPHKCIECGRGFYTKRDLDIHFNADHSGMKDYGCNVCGNKYSTRKALMRHGLRVHKRDKMAQGRLPLHLQPEYRKCNEDN